MMDNIALCKCGVDMTDHPDIDPMEEWEGGLNELAEGFDHFFDAAGTRHRCEELIEFAQMNVHTGEPVKMVFMCPRPRYHKEHDVPCGPLLDKKLWT